MLFQRALKRPASHFFLFGPRGTGKSTWLEKNISKGLFINLLRSSDYLPLLKDPSQLRQIVLGSNAEWIIIDEIQRLPLLLNEVHQLIFENKNKYKFALTGSSARKLKKQEANLLAGRAIRREFYPLTSAELSFDFIIEEILMFGTLPEVYNFEQRAEKIDFLESYVETYLKEEISQEALTRNLDSFVRFLDVAAILNGQPLNISNVASDVGIARTTVDSYFSILTDTLLASRIEGFRIKAKVKEVVQAKNYFFDCGVVRALSGKLREPLNPLDQGYLFETFILKELRAYSAYQSCGYKIGYWGTPSDNEVDFVIKSGSFHYGVEVKTSKEWKGPFNRGLRTLLETGKIKRAYGVYWGQRILKSDNITVYPVIDFCKALWRGDLFEA